MKFGIHLNHEYEKSDDLGDRIDQLIRICNTARDLGLDSIVGMHHYLSSLATLQPLPLLARLIPETGDMRIGMGVYLAYEHPVILAENFATLDQLSGGRLILGLGAGYRENEFNALGLDRATRVSRMFEAVELIKAFWTGEPVDFHGRHFSVSGEAASIVPAQQPRPPIWLGANGEKGVRRVARHADSWIAPPNVKTRWANGHLGFFKDELERVGVDPATREYPLIRELYIGDSDVTAAAEVSDYLREEYAMYSVYGEEVEYWRTMFPELLEKAFVIGSPETVADKLAAFNDAGFDHFIFRIAWKGMPFEQSLQTLQRLGTEVMPRLQGVATR
ncbi:MAG TPA: LLM class flavin-dependent oxidoreductase [Solirubrobacteraceae bacterium]|nr:LLM class flavin-dependent oxidoreductase [Solirubrobacteraceae bacterium]